MPKGMTYSNQAETMGSTGGNDPHLSTGMGKSLKMPSAGIKKGGSVNLLAATRSDANKG